MMEESRSFLPNLWKSEGEKDVCIPGLDPIYTKVKGKIPLHQTIHTDQASKYIAALWDRFPSA